MLYRPQYFKLYELVSPNIYHQFKEFAWNFLDVGLLQDIDLLREKWGKPLIINNWYKGGQYRESGMRCNIDNIVKNKTTAYCSGHVLGKAYDIKPQKMSDLTDLYLCTIDNYDNFQSLSRLENIIKTPTWQHIDCLQPRNTQILIF